MEKQKIEIEKCNVGDVIAEEVQSEYGAVIVVKNTVINEYIKKKMMRLGVQNVCIYGGNAENQLSLSEKNSLVVKKNYKESIRNTEALIKRLANGEKMKIEKINKESDLLYSCIDKERYIVNCLNELKDADEYTYTHSINVSFYSMLLGKWLKLPEKHIKELIQAGLLHDVGKTKIPIEILNKPGRLEKDEFEEIKKHTIYGYDIVQNIEGVSENIKNAVLMHHEREDHSGYPLGKSGEDLNIHSKIIAVADVYDAITSDRVYKKRATPFEAFEIFQTQNLKDFDIHVMNTFLSNISICYIGCKVLLSNGEKGEIVYIPPHNITKPIVSVGTKYIDLSKEKLKIEGMV